MKVLTFGWEFPPSKNGGLGVACYGLTRELLNYGIEVIFVLPRAQETQGNARFLFAEFGHLITTHEVDSYLQPYHQAGTTVDIIIGYDQAGKPIIRSRTILEEVHRFAHNAAKIARQETFDVIHAHDWTAYLAGVAAKVATGKPLIVHVHATSFDQAASSNVDPSIYQIEHEGFSNADKIVTVSNYTKNILVQKHNVPAEKVEVVHNGCDTETRRSLPPTLKELKESGKKVVLYHGRISIQKGVDYFVKAAKRVIEVEPNVVFIISGWGDMTTQILQQVGELGLGEHVLFAGALWDEERDRMYQTADLVVMPSVSEPFGLVPLEALHNGTSPLISKQSGVSEVLTHALKVDFWDIDEMANQIVASLRYPVLREQIVKEGQKQLLGINWRKAARKVKQIYESLVQWFRT